MVRSEVWEGMETVLCILYKAGSVFSWLDGVVTMPAGTLLWWSIETVSRWNMYCYMRYSLKKARDYGMNFSKRLVAPKKRSFA